jgi:flavin-dependent dehydrogenase
LLTLFSTFWNLRYSTWAAFQKLEKEWAELKASMPFKYDTTWFKKVQDGIPPPYQFVTEDATWSHSYVWSKLRSQRDKPLDYDIIVCGGNLGIFFAMAMQLKGENVCVVDGGDLIDDEQEWFLSVDELEELRGLGVVTGEDILASVQTELMEDQVGTTPEEKVIFSINPAILIDRVAKRFEEYGGTILEQTPLYGVAISSYTGAAVDLGEDKEPLTASLIIDCMGSTSPITRQQRYGMKPDGVCVVVGTCAAGFDEENEDGQSNTISDFSSMKANGQQQYFVEAFHREEPKQKGFFNLTDLNPFAHEKKGVKTTYMYTFMDVNKNRPSLEKLMEDYWSMLSHYQPSIMDPERDLDIKRVLFGYFPTFDGSPLKPQWNRLLAVGDASGIQSPLSFGGLGPMARHLARITSAVSDALENEFLHKDDLAEINAYTPSLSATWMLHKAMSMRTGKHVDPKSANRLLVKDFMNMDDRDEPVYVGLPKLMDWTKHVGMMGVYGLLDSTVSPAMEKKLEGLDARSQFKWRRRMEAWKYGSGHADDKSKGKKHNS